MAICKRPQITPHEIFIGVAILIQIISRRMIIQIIFKNSSTLL
jgi:hypothetical protein